MQIKLRYLINEIKFDLIKEVLDFNNIKSFEFTKLNNFEYEFEDHASQRVYVQFEEFIGDEIKQYFEFNPFLEDKLNKIYNCGFSINDITSKYRNDTLQDAFPLWKTIVLISHDFISNNQPECVTIFADSRDNSGVGKDSTKTRVFKLMIEKNAPSGYEISNVVLKPENVKGNCIYKQ